MLMREWWGWISWSDSLRVTAEPSERWPALFDAGAHAHTSTVASIQTTDVADRRSVALCSFGKTIGKLRCVSSLTNQRRDRACPTGFRRTPICKGPRSDRIPRSRIWWRSRLRSSPASPPAVPVAPLAYITPRLNCARASPDRPTDATTVLRSRNRRADRPLSLRADVRPRDR